MLFWSIRTAKIPADRGAARFAATFWRLEMRNI